MNHKLQIAPKNHLGNPIGTSFRFAREACLAALKHVDDSRQMCVIAGQKLRELKADKVICQHGDFIDLVEKYIPEISRQTATTWMRAAESVTRALGFPAVIEIDSVVTPLSEILAGDRSKLSKAGQKLAQAWFDFTEHKTIKDCISGVVVDGDPDSRIVRAINGKMAKGAGGGGDRKDFPTFIGKKLSQLTTHLQSYKNFTGPQLERVEQLTKQNFAKMPSGYLELVMKIVREELKTR